MEYEAEQVYTLIIKPSPVRRYYEDPFTGKHIWYDKEEAWEWLGGPDEQSQYTKGPDELQEIP